VAVGRLRRDNTGSRCRSRRCLRLSLCIAHECQMSMTAFRWRLFHSIPRKLGACRLSRRGDAFAEQRGGDKRHGQDWQAHRNLPKFIELLKSYPMQLSRLTPETMALPIRRSRNATMRPALACGAGAASRGLTRPRLLSRVPLREGRGHRCDSDSHAQTRHARQEAAGAIGQVASGLDAFAAKNRQREA